MDIVVHYPETKEGMAELQTRIATIHAEAVASYIENLSCPKEQKLRLYDEIKKACQNR